jgi:hypothetical protein
MTWHHRCNSRVAMTNIDLEKVVGGVRSATHVRTKPAPKPPIAHLGKLKTNINHPDLSIQDWEAPFVMP